MKLPGLILSSLSLLGAAATRGADATTPVDYTQRNAPFAPAATVAPEKKTFPRADTVQEKRFDKPAVEKQPAAVGDRRAPIAVEETRDKQVREKTSSRPEGSGQPLSAFNHREAGITTAADTKKPPLVAKYQDSLAAASMSNMARFPALDQATTAKINRFVFLKNPPDPTSFAQGFPVSRAASGRPDDVSAKVHPSSAAPGTTGAQPAAEAVAKPGATPVRK